MIRYFKTWNNWQKRCGNSFGYKVLVLFKLAKSPTFEVHKIFNYVEKKRRK